MIKIYDSMIQKLKVLNDNENHKINMYLCGPTVYNYIHIGNARPVIVLDVLHRLLIHQKFTINYVHNITDIDDKIINQARAQNTSETAISEKYTLSYLADLKRLNIITPTIMPKVSQYINQIINFIDVLIKKENAYVAKDGVYFKISALKNYGALAHKKITDLIPNYRIKATENKLAPLDFALWKITNSGKSWESPWGKGRPGWHTECAVFIQELFNGATIDLHGGGVDLKFPHHENERAQFYAYNGQELAKIWWHNGHVNSANEKMSKSLNNFILVKDFCEKYHPYVLRYCLLNHEHQQPIALQESTIKQGIITIQKYENCLKQWTYHLFINSISNCEGHAEEYYQKLINYLANNIDTTNALTLIETMIKKINAAIINKNFTKTIQNIFYTFHFALELLGFSFGYGNYSNEVKTKIKLWEKLKAEKNYQAADKIRNELQQLNII